MVLDGSLSAPSSPEQCEIKSRKSCQASSWLPLLCGRRPSRWLCPSPVLAGVVKGLAPDRSRAPEPPGRAVPAVPAVPPGRR